MTGVLQVPELDDAIERSADPTLARLALGRALESVPGLAPLLRDDDVAREAAVAVASVSRSLGAALASDPDVLTAVLDPLGIDTARSIEQLRASWNAARDADGDPIATLRRWKRRELLRIADRDLTGRADLPAVGHELADLADVCLAAALEIAAPEVPLAVIGMGKLGGHELNYASDVDVIFVHEGDSDPAIRAARSVLATMTSPTGDGIVFRTDADLRPEGRSGSLSRSIESFAAYYEKWALTWEFQALIKARPVAGAPGVGRRFLEMVEPFVWPERRDPDAVREVRAGKARAENEMRKRGLDERELKRGRGGIRDIEFAVQLLQLVHGGSDTSVRSATTLDALAALAARGYVERGDAAHLDDAYRFLRTAEHRLQLYDEQQTHTLPVDDAARSRLARAMGYRDRGDESALQQFDTDHRQKQAIVRAIHERLFFEPLLETLAGAGALPGEAAEQRLAAFGFVDAAQTRAALRELASGLSRTSRLMHRLLPVILGWLSAAPDPDLGLLQLRRLAEGPARSASLATTFRESPVAAERTCKLLGSSRLLGNALRRQPDFVAMLGDDVALTAEKTRDDMVAEATDTLAWRASDPEARRQGLRRFKRRELLRIAARDVLGLADLVTIERDLAALAEACVEGALRSLDTKGAPPFTVIGMGRFGGGELSYASDLDVLFVYEGDGAARFDAAERLATRLMREIGATTTEGQTFRIDANLRPEGKPGPLARSLEGYRTYYERWALTWEFQALIKARPVAGDRELARRFCELVEPYVYREPFAEPEAREVRRMKARIERERIPPGEDPQFHLKLGRGSLSDVEFTVQLLQLQHGAARPELRVTGTIDATERLAAIGLLAPDDATALIDSYRYCERARNARYLLTGAPGDSLPTAPADAARLGRLLGYVRRPATSLRDDYRRLTRRARRVVERVFYERDGGEP